MMMEERDLISLIIAWVEERISVDQGLHLIIQVFMAEKILMMEVLDLLKKKEMEWESSHFKMRII